MGGRGWGCTTGGRLPPLLMKPAGGIREVGAEELGPEWLGGLVVMHILTF